MLSNCADTEQAGLVSKTVLSKMIDALGIGEQPTGSASEDKNDDDKDESKSCDASGFGPSDQAALLQYLDRNKDGVITYAELLQFCGFETGEAQVGRRQLPPLYMTNFRGQT
eukprot:SAG31_NODE_7551_length_1657_cov_2.351733_2_plen_112_part_00